MQQDILQATIRITSAVLASAREFLNGEGFVELLPVILAPVTDPLRHTTERAEVEAYGQRWHLTRSMIFHKQAAVRLHERVFAFSPNVRLEPAARADSGRHLFEFVQLDLEVRDADRELVMDLGERLLCRVADEVGRCCAQELAQLGQRPLRCVPPFPRISYDEAARRLGQAFEERLSAESTQPVWLVDFPIHAREFYDREDPRRPGVLLDMDLIYPQGFGEALSGGEREHCPQRIAGRLADQGLDPGAYSGLLRLARDGIPPSAGFGIGIERLVRFLCGLEHVGLVRPFARVPGRPADL